MYPDDLETRQIEDEVKELVGSVSASGSDNSAQKVDTSSRPSPFSGPSPFAYGSGK
jgi:hypothetical protein